MELVRDPVCCDQMLLTDPEEGAAAAVRIREHEGLAPDGKVERILNPEARDASGVQYGVAFVAKFKRIGAYLALKVFKSLAREQDVGASEFGKVGNRPALAGGCLPRMQTRDQRGTG